jgi:hypothetical protein
MEPRFAHATPAGPFAAGRPLTSPDGLLHAGTPNDIVSIVLLACPAGLDRAGRSPSTMLACDHSEKFDGKVRNLRHRTNFVINSVQI